jgi:hypothetical protein
MEKLRFENDMIFRRLQKETQMRKGKSGLYGNTRVENSNDVDLNFNTKVNYVEHLQRKLIGKT